MTHPYGVSQWHTIVSSHLPDLSVPQRTVLVLWSIGIVLAHSCGLSRVALLLAVVLDQHETTVRERLRDFYRDAEHKSGYKRGDKRRSLDVRACFPALLRWVLSLMPADCRHLALAMDASTLGQRLTILTITVVIRSCAIPIAWHIVEATRPGAWKPHWQGLFRQFDGCSGEEWTVIVAADRGLWANWLFTSITELGWHPLLRIDRQGQYRPAGETSFRPLSQAVSKGGPDWCGAVTCFATKARQLECTLLARWETGYKDPWLLLTDLPAVQADVAWYGMRPWVECGYKDAKRGGWHWEQTKMTNPQRAERLWLAMALATVLVVSSGCQAEAALPVPVCDDLPSAHIARRRATHRPRSRSLSCFCRGQIMVVAALVAGQGLPVMRLVPEPWPKSFDTQVTVLNQPLSHSNAEEQKPFT